MIRPHRFYTQTVTSVDLKICFPSERVNSSRTVIVRTGIHYDNAINGTAFAFQGSFSCVHNHDMFACTSNIYYIGVTVAQRLTIYNATCTARRV